MNADLLVPEAGPSGAGSDADVEGEVRRIVFRNDDNGYSVLRVDRDGGEVVVVGNVGRISEGEHLSAWGEWVQDPRYGRQLRARRIDSRLPSSSAGIEKYLASSLVKGVGPVYAKKLVAAFGTDVLRVIDDEPERLREVPGIGSKRVGQILEAWAEQRAVREVMIFLHENGLGAGRAAAVYAAYGDNTIEFVRRNPYRLARDIRGIGFHIADRFAMGLGIERNAPERLQAGLLYTLLQAAGEGHCGLPEEGEEGIVARAAGILGVDADEVAEALVRAVAAGEIVRDFRDGLPCAFDPELLRNEREIATGLRRLLDAPLPWREIDGERALAWSEQNGGMEFSDSQRDALMQALQSKVLVITGGPGVGKTTIVNSLLRILQAKKVAVELCAPTGRAANRLATTTGQAARTIHRLLEINPAAGEFRRNGDNPLECDLVIVDETSMVDVPLMAALVRALPREAALILVGDVDQLPSVGPGHVLGDIITSGAVPVARLTEVHRQAGTSQIVTNAHRINRGEDPEFSPPGRDGDFFFVNVEEPEAAAAKIVEVVARIRESFDLNPMTEVQVLAPMHKGPLGTEALNERLRAKLNPGAARLDRRGGGGFSVADKVMQTENDYEKEVYNGEIGIVQAIDPGTKSVLVRIGGKILEYAYGELHKLTPAYAVTIHKSQGSEYPAVVIPVSTQHWIMLRRNLLYTAVTRAEKLVVLVGQRKALHGAIRNTGGRDRCTKLGELLAEAA